MLTAFSKTFPKNKISESNKISRSYETPVDSVHDITQRPLQCIQEPTMDEEDREEDCHNNVKSNSFDGESLSTHDSVHVFHNKGILICYEEGKIIRDDRSEIGNVPSQDLDEEGETEEAGKKMQTKYPVKDDDINLSFHMDDSIFDSSDLYRVLDGDNEAESLGNCQGSYESPRLKNEDEVNFEGAFANLGQVMFKNQPDRIVSECKSSRTVEEDVQKKLFEGWTRQVWSHARLLVFFLSGVAVTYTFISIPIGTKKDSVTHIYGDVLQDQDLMKEVFLRAMYMLSTFPQCSDRDVDNVPSYNFILLCLPYTIAVLVIAVVMHVYNTKNGHANMKYEKDFSLLKKTPTSCKTEGSSHKKRQRLKREIASLDKGDIVSSSYITEIITPTGELSSVKRSSRIEGRKMKENIESSRVNLTGFFHLEDGDTPSKTHNTV